MILTWWRPPLSQEEFPQEFLGRKLRELQQLWQHTPLWTPGRVTRIPVKYELIGFNFSRSSGHLEQIQKQTDNSSNPGN